MRDQEPPAAAADGQGPGPNALMGRRPGVGGEAGGDNSAIRADTASNGAGAEPPPAAATRAQTETAFSSWLGGSSRSLGAGLAPTPTKATATGGAARIPPPSPIAASISGGSSDPRAATSVLHDAARITSWDRVHSLALSQPASARYTAPDGWTPLHHTCSRRCPHAYVVEALFRAYPGALVCPDDRGFTPLHHAARFKAPRDVVRLLLRDRPEMGKVAAAKRCSRGRSPLFYAIRYDAPEGVIGLLLEADPAAVLDPDRDGVTPLSLVWDKHVTSFEGKRAIQPIVSALNGYLEAAPGRRQPLGHVEVPEKLRGPWEMANMLLRASFGFPICGEEEKADAPDSGTGYDRDGRRVWRILHAACAIKCHLTLFQLACILHPEQAAETDSNDLYGGSDVGTSDLEGWVGVSMQTKTALHFAASSPARGRIVLSTLLALNPSAASFPCSTTGSLPLHIAAENESKINWTHDGAVLLYKAHPEAVMATDAKGRTPLHRACSSAFNRAAGPREEAAATSTPATYTAESASLADQAENPAAAVVTQDTAASVGSIIQNLVSLYPEAATIPDSSGRLPLHLIAEHFENWSHDVEVLLRSHPAAAHVRAGTLGRQPIHMVAAAPDSRASLIEGIIKAHPRGASLSDGSGMLPLHLACGSGKPFEGFVSSLYDAYPRAVREKEDNERGWTALHMAASCSNSGSLINHLIRLHPEAAREVDDKGRYPLHLACTSGKSWEGGVQAIFNANPDAAISADSLGRFPFHCTAMANHASISAGGGGDPVEAMSTINVLFCLLREGPTVL